MSTLRIGLLRTSGRLLFVLAGAVPNRLGVGLFEPRVRALAPRSGGATAG